MIVYGDPAFTVSAAEVTRAFEAGRKAQTLDQWRDLLIAAGQVEQAVADCGERDEAARTFTDQCASAFLARLRGEAAQELGQFPAPKSGLRIKVPEGYAFYTVFPEQYVRATGAWLTAHDNPGRVLVVGIRSIGTSLSAVVQAILRSAKVDVARVTVRPAGHPFQRTVQAEFPTGEFQYALIVDEGPGLSGSFAFGLALLVSRREHPTRINPSPARVIILFTKKLSTRDWR